MTEINDSLERMLKAERQAREIVQEAEKQAAKLQDDAQRAASEILSRARDDARTKAAAIVDEAAAQARAEKQQQIEAVRQKLESLPDQIPDDRRKEAVRLILDAITR